jgi:hypothetical protein
LALERGDDFVGASGRHVDEGVLVSDAHSPEKLAREIPSLRPTDGIVSGPGQWCLAAPGRDYLIYAERTDRPIVLDLASDAGNYRAHWIDAKTGAVSEGDTIAAGKRVELPAHANVLWLEKLSDN